jgi:hypothetical protein
VIKHLPSATPFETDEVGLLERRWIQIRLCTGEVGLLNPDEDFGYANRGGCPDIHRNLSWETQSELSLGGAEKQLRRRGSQLPEI